MSLDRMAGDRDRDHRGLGGGRHDRYIFPIYRLNPNIEVYNSQYTGIKLP